MAFHAEIIADSVGPDGQRITSFLRTYPHAIHKDLLRHNAMNFSALSFRAYPTAKLVRMLEEDPFVPEHFQEYAPGMNVGELLDPALERECRRQWLKAKDAAVAAAKHLMDAGVNKGHANILIQDFCWMTEVVTATEWDNFWALRANPPANAKPRAEVIKIASMMKDLYDASEPVYLKYGQPHLPLIRDDDLAEVADVAEMDGEREAYDELIKISSGRCARASYLTHLGVRSLFADVELHDSLLTNHHMSPLAHQAWPIPITGMKYVEVEDPRAGLIETHGPDWRDKYWGWCSYRQTIPAQHDASLVLGSTA